MELCKDNAKFLRRSATDVSSANMALRNYQAIATIIQDADNERKKIRAKANEPPESNPKIQAKLHLHEQKKSEKKHSGNSQKNPPLQTNLEPQNLVTNATKTKPKRSGPKIKPQRDFEKLPRDTARYVFVGADRIPEHNYLLKQENENLAEVETILNPDDSSPYEPVYENNASESREKLAAPHLEEARSSQPMEDEYNSEDPTSSVSKLH